MSLLNISLNLLGYLDQTRTAQPLVRLADIKYSMLGMPTETPQVVPFSLAPQQSVTIANTARSTSYSGSTSFSIALVTDTSNARLVGTYGQRTARVYGDATTQWTVSLTNQVCRLTYTSTGSAPTFGGMSVGDGLTIESDSDFNALNQGDFVITNVGANYVEFINPVATGETITDLVKIYSNGPVQVGDTLYITNTSFNYVNQGAFVVTRVTDQYIEFSNAQAIAQGSMTGITSGVAVYNGFNQWMMLAVDQRVVVKLNGDTGTGVECEPPTPNDLPSNPGLLLKRGRVFQVVISNPGLVTVNGFCFLAA